MQKEVVITNPLGIHSRPSGEIMKKAKIYPCMVTLTKEGREVNAKSIVSILTLELQCGDRVLLKTEGDREEEALQEIGDLLESFLD
ncbi:HPr family phosphocarrier protein [Saccharibacillus sp. CPCC 101409]|uniref:HPr family phosphocarrier protein n=1 Tax=Saccharibacillus sp. CPCC 101409 TaxID=3058041 RepID=UPI0026738A3F|nr:HPr family phosphocarrier protein [Saccharibacillus sp. CPCC 101409]MDO3409770.1 HPr family phosphocarrier protein [Saccharibacillus sp. CPCC 101409]